MKHYRFKSAKAHNTKQDQRPVAMIAILSIVVVYSVAWLCMAYSLKRLIEEEIDYSNKNKSSVYINYSDIDMRGFPVSVKAIVNDMRVTIDSSDAARFVASMIENPEDPFPKLSHKQIYSTLEEPVVISKNIFEKEYKITIPKELVAKHSFDNQSSLDVIYKFNSSPYIFIDKREHSNLNPIISPKLRWISELHNFTITVPSYQLRGLNGDNLITESQGVNLSIYSDIKESGIAYHINYTDLGTRYTDEIATLIDPLMQTLYFQHLARTAPMQYEELGYVKKYTEGGEHKTNLEAVIQLQSDDYDSNGDLQIDVHLNRLDQTDDYGSLNGFGTVKALLNNKTNKLKFDNQLYLAASLKEIWHSKWLNSIDRAFKNINVNQQIAPLKDKLKMLLPNIYNYQYATLGYKFGYDGDASLKSKSGFSLDYLRIQTDKFAITAEKGDDFGDDLRKLPLNFKVKIHNYPKVLQITTDYLHGLVHAPEGNKAALNNKVTDGLTAFLNDVKYSDSLCKNNWHGQLKLVKGDWYLGNYRLSTIQSIILSIALKG